MKHRGLNRGSYMSAHVLLNLLSELGKRHKMRGLLSIYVFFTTSLIINNTGAQMLGTFYHITLGLF